MPEFVIVKGRVCVDDGLLRVAQGHGSFTETPVYPPYVYNPLNGTKNGVNADDSDVNGLEQVTSNIEELAIEIPTPEPITSFLSGPALSVMSTDTRASTPTGRAMRQEGQRNMQDSTFSISGEKIFNTKKNCVFSSVFILIYTNFCRGNGHRTAFLHSCPKSTRWQIFGILVNGRAD